MEQAEVSYYLVFTMVFVLKAINGHGATLKEGHTYLTEKTRNKGLNGTSHGHPDSYGHNVHNVHNVDNVHNIHDVHNALNVHNLHNVNNVQNVQNIQNVKCS